MNDSIEPQRLLDDPNVAGLGQLRGDLQAAASAAPLRYDVEAGLARFQAQLAHASAAGTGVASGSSLAVGKVVAGVAGLLVVGGAAWALLAGGPTSAPDGHVPSPTGTEAVVVAPTPVEAERTRDEAEVPAETADVPPPTVEPTAVSPVVTDDEVEPTAAGSEPAPEPVSAGEQREARASARSKRREAGGDQTSDFLREAKKVQQAKKALDRDPARTLRLLREVEREFPNGQLAEEREGLYVLALLGMGKNDEGKRRADAYLARYPRGTLATRVRRALAQLP